MTTTAAVGGEIGSDRYLELAVNTNVFWAARMIREASAAGDIALAVARNPAPVSYVRRHAALGGLTSARRLGQVLLKNIKKGLSAVLGSVAEAAGGVVLALGLVSSATTDERKGFTVGRIVIDREGGGRIVVPVCNEYMMAIKDHSPLAAFPDLITIFDCQSALPLNSVEVRAGRKVAILVVPRENLRLGSTMRDRSLLRPIEDLIKFRFPVPERSESWFRTFASKPIATNL